VFHHVVAEVVDPPFVSLPVPSGNGAVVQGMPVDTVGGYFQPVVVDPLIGIVMPDRDAVYTVAASHVKEQVLRFSAFCKNVGECLCCILCF